MNYRMTRHDIELLTESIPAEEKTCGACAYWDHQSVRGLLVPPAAGVDIRAMAVCAHPHASKKRAPADVQQVP